MDVIVTGRRCTITDSTREYVTERLNESIVKLKDRVIRTEVEFTSNDPKGDPSSAIRCEITLRGKGPVIRASGSADEKIAAFELALDKLRAQLRRAADRRKKRHGLRVKELPVMAEESAPETQDEANDTHEIAGLTVQGDGPLVVREKTFETTPLTLAQALDEMELVGHDFFLFQDAASGKPSVVYRRKAYNYGVIRLEVQ
ncbi:ribosomal subunit interface protein [Propionibacterium cyclohexanicum]|uniref:Ribosome hibernation promoting factor n=1 Tax=Propionibacterium cyclohexanicum TaxID=64702 RepID=A0A1H9RC56_9ACTN|nr:ribosome-associated translation inhibitor RaiA [Propionibacterium cyclohexanicum]SER69619.1 ribosomal subunit interface protein [Propionibacterium cyclohexanicum]